LSQKLLDRRSLSKLAPKLWKSLCKHIREQVEQGSIVDTLFFGTFAKSKTLSRPDRSFVYCPGPKPVLNLVESDHNVSNIAQSLLDEKLITINVSLLAEECETNLETATSFFGGVRDEVVDQVLNK
jgi:hypothetical protein